MSVEPTIEHAAQQQSIQKIQMTTIYHNPNCGTSRNTWPSFTKEDGAVVINEKGQRV
jgi:hypothetical protein